MPLGVVHFRNCTCANRSRALACGAAGLRVSGRSVLRTVPEAFTLRPRLGVRARKCSLWGRGVLHVDSSRAAPDFVQAGGEVLFARQGSVACGVPARRAGLVRGPRARRLERQVLLFPIVSACRMLASGCVSVKGKASSGGGKKDNPKTVRPSGCRLGLVPAISFLASGRRCRVQGCGTVRIPPANSPASSRRACRSSPTSSVR